MPAHPPSALTIITSALRKLGVMGAADPTPESEDIELGLQEYNEIVEQWNVRKRRSFYEQMQAFPWGTLKEQYTIGPPALDPADNPDFIVSNGGRPVRIEFAQLTLTDQPQDVQVNIAVIHIEQYMTFNVPQLASTFPLSIYYQPTWPNGTIYPYPIPQRTDYRLNLVWWHQMLTASIDEITLPIQLPFVYVRALALTLAEALYLAFPKKTDLAELSRQARLARSDMEAQNTPPPKISTTDGVRTTGSTFDWRSRTAF